MWNVDLFFKCNLITKINYIISMFFNLNADRVAIRVFVLL